MKLHYSDNMFCLEGNITDNDLAKRAGFAWDRHTHMWYTPFSTVARKLIKYAQPGVADLIKEHEITERRNEIASRETRANLHVPAPAGLEYMPFQIAGIDYLRKRNNALLADQMGLGKTIQVIGLCNLLLEIKSVLVICPATLKLNWQREWRKWRTRELTVGVAYAKKYPTTDVVIINYDILAKHHEAIHSLFWDLVVLDEAHYLKNQKAIRTKEVVGYRTKSAIKARRKIALTGTPIVNRPIELFNVIRYLAPFAWYDKLKYARRYCKAFQGRWGWDMTGASNLKEFQQKLRSTVMIRRLKKDVLHDLPDKIRQVIEVKPSGRVQDLLYKQMKLAGFSNKKEYQEKMLSWASQNLTQTGFEEMSTIRREVAESKIPFIISHLKDAVAASGKVVCFCHHKVVVHALKKAFHGECVVVDGNVDSDKRQRCVDSFQTRKEVKLFIGNIQAAGTGITLTAASHVVFAEISWVPGEIEQCEDRCHRIGTKDSVLIQFLVMATSIDAAIAMAYTSKQGIIETAIDEKTPESIELANMLM